ncbi:Ribonuclease H [Lasiodiplodia hormozganensis]|uniref:ribonuclease H n=1 Tax=Lasiodiplodia hormozganensis TaxID=869390 RepID=A0AA40D230_9PEZI|nr:Ribonuclease H [Lasiodiplodia hormozganensis]
MEDNPRLALSETITSRAPIITRARERMGAGSYGVWTATVFVPPPGASPDDLFAPRNVFDGFKTYCFVLRRRHIPAVGSLRTAAIFIDGACSDNGSRYRSPRGGCAFVTNPGPGGTFGFPLEQEGPFGEPYPHTSNRAELRAAIAALEFHGFVFEGWERLVLITDSQYVSRHATHWLRVWSQRGWRTTSGQPIKNRDLWEALSEEMGWLAHLGCEVSFWMVPRRWNTVADAVAKAATRECGNEKFYELSWQLVQCWETGSPMATPGHRD